MDSLAKTEINDSCKNQIYQFVYKNTIPRHPVIGLLALWGSRYAYSFAETYGAEKLARIHQATTVATAGAFAQEFFGLDPKGFISGPLEYLGYATAPITVPYGMPYLSYIAAASAWVLTTMTLNTIAQVYFNFKHRLTSKKPLTIEPPKNAIESFNPPPPPSPTNAKDIAKLIRRTNAKFDEELTEFYDKFPGNENRLFTTTVSRQPEQDSGENAPLLQGTPPESPEPPHDPTLDGDVREGTRLLAPPKKGESSPQQKPLDLSPPSQKLEEEKAPIQIQAVVDLDELEKMLAARQRCPNIFRLWC